MSGYYTPGLNAYLDEVLTLEAHEELLVPKNLIPHPFELGFEISFGEPKGQVADYRAELPDGRGLHVRDLVSRWSIHWDHVFPSLKRWVDHLREDSPVWFGLFILGLVIGAAVLLYFLLSALVRRING